MWCPRCGSKTKVLNSRTALAGPTHCNTGPARQAKRAVGWFTNDWVARDRRCTECDLRYNTVEIPMSDLREGWEPCREVLDPDPIEGVYSAS